jgi:septum formation protein
VTAAPELILASASPRRLELLAQAGITPSHILPADIDETPCKGELPNHYALRVATEKAEALAKRHPGKIVLAADTVVACGRTIFPKVEDEATARQCVRRLTGRRHRVYTAVVVIGAGGKLSHTVAMTMVRMKRVSAAEIERFIASREWHGKAGGYAIQGLAGAFIPAINGSYSNVVGLPLTETLQLLAQAGITPD